MSETYWVYAAELLDEEPEADEEGLFAEVVLASDSGLSALTDQEIEALIGVVVAAEWADMPGAFDCGVALAKLRDELSRRRESDAGSE